MSRASVAFSVTALSFCILTAGSTLATAQTEQPIYGRQLMTEQEALEYRQKMRAVTSDEERQRIRAEHHEEMQERAKSKGVVLPDEVSARGMRRGMGPGQGGGPGAGR
jgi:thermostable 8-oxoguanine DNA glycosylase